MHRTIFVISTLSAILVGSNSVSAQTPAQLPNPSQCTLTPSQSPAIRGIRLGMTAEALLALFPQSSQSHEIKRAIENAQAYPNYGTATLYFQPSMYPSVANDRFAGIASISATLFDGRVVEFVVIYAGPPIGPTWPNLDEFIARLSEVFGLPGSRDWIQRDGSSKMLPCQGLEIDVSKQNGGGSITIRTRAYLVTVRERAAKAEEKRRTEFRP